MTPLVKAPPQSFKDDDKLIEATAKHMGISLEESRQLLAAEIAKEEIWVNEKYQVAAHGFEHPDLGLCLQINIRRRDGGVIFRDWRDFQQIKNQLAGPESEGLEIYPAESRKVDTSNKYHIWCVLNDPAQPDKSKRIPFGWYDRDVLDQSDTDLAGTRQRPLPASDPEARINQKKPLR